MAEMNAQGYAPEEAAQRMSVAEGFSVELVAAEPLVRQPVAIDFDNQGRLWALQYLQYPNPAGLKRVKVDRYSRTTYDRVPKPPPYGPKGADRLTILEDTDGDGRVDKAKDFVSGLNLATGFAFGRGGVFVLQTPYLLFYPDRDRDDIPDSNPEVLLTGFGMQDSSSLANSLVWGPDGWLYGAHGTNITASIRGIKFEQGLWRYHPERNDFELFCEGGSNMWGLDFDRDGNLLAGTNYGGYLMFHAVQGAYFQKSFAKHGELHNPFAFGYFGHVPHKNFQGGHVTVGGFLYQADAFPSRFRDKYISVDTLGHAARWHHVTPNASTLQSENGGLLLQANDTWFAPSDCTLGPDGAVYIADWHDQRTAHPDPDATWDRRNGRVFRLKWNAAKPVEHFDPDALSTDQLIHTLKSSNEWHVRRARQVLAVRREPSVAANLKETVLTSKDESHVLQALWTLATIGQFDDPIGNELLDHSAANIRSWAIRLLGDTKQVSKQTWQKMILLAESESSPVVVSQLAASAKRLPAEQCIPIARAIAARSEFQSDPYIPLLTWWAIEHHAISGVDEVLQAFANPPAWKSPMLSEMILGRLMRRYAGDGSSAGLRACAVLLAAAPDDSKRRQMITNLDAGLKLLGRKKTPRLPLPENRLAIKQVDRPHVVDPLNEIPSELANALDNLWSEQTTDALTIRVSARLGNRSALHRAVALAADKIPTEQRLQMMAILQELGDTETCFEAGMQFVGNAEPDVIRIAALKMLARVSDERITKHLLLVYQDMSESLRMHACDVLLGRAESALAFLQAIDRGKFPAEEVTVDQLRRVALHQDEKIDALVQKHWGNFQAGTHEEKLAEIRRIRNDLRAGSGNTSQGKLAFKKHCATCHKLFDDGNEIGPDLTTANRTDRDFLLVSIVDPNAQIRKEYLNYTVVTRDGRILTGLLAEQTRASVTVLDAKNQRTTIANDEVESMMVSSVSLMPEKTLNELTPQQTRDLFAYLQSRKEQDASEPNTR